MPFTLIFVQLMIVYSDTLIQSQFAHVIKTIICANESF